MEEIDIIELLKRLKKGRAPKEIEIYGTKYYLKDNAEAIDDFYKDGSGYGFFGEYLEFDTKIKILDKPFIEELPTRESTLLTFTDLADKINEIIRYLRSKDER